MSTPSFGQPSVFGTPGPPPVPDAPVEVEGTKGRRTVLIAVAAGVVALGVLGGAAALVLGGDPAETVDTALPPAGVATVDPSVAPSAPSTPLPTAVVQGRNVFVPLVHDETAAAGEGGVVDPVAAAEPTTAPTSAPVTGTTGGGTGGTGGTGGVGSLPLPVPTVTVTESTTLTEFLTDTELLRELRQQIADLEAQLADSDDRDVVEELQDEIARLQAELTEVLAEPAYDFDVFVQDVVDPANPDTDVVFVLADDTQVSGFSTYTVNATMPLDDRRFGPQDELTFMTYTPADPDNPDAPEGVVTFQYVSNVYRVVEGTALGFSPAPAPTPAPTPAP